MTGDVSYEVKKDSKETQTPKELVKDFCSYTTTHGIGRLAEAKTLFTRSIWTVFILGAFAMFFFQTYGLFTLYLSRPVSTVVKVRHKTEVKFPAVTICNQNAIKNDEIPEDYIDNIYKEIFEVLDEENKGDDKDTGDVTSTPDYQNDTEDNSGTDELFDPEEELRIDYLFQEFLLSYLALENQTALYKMGHKYEDFVFDCNFRGIDCRKNYSKYWHNFWDYRYGNCFTFNGGMDDKKNNQTILATHNTGPFGGLTLNIFIESAQYVPEVSQAAGARIAIHNQGEMPFPDDDGINLVPGFSTSVGVRRDVIERVDPFNNESCRSSNSHDHEDIYHKNFGSFYSRESCMRSCLAKIQIKQCGCAEGRFPIDDRYICNTIKKPDSGFCLDDLIAKFDAEGLGCDPECPVPCSEVVYKTTMSMAEWPSEGYQETLFKRVLKRKNAAYEQQKADGSESLHRNFLQVKVFFERLNFQEVKEQLSYKGINLIADIGGQLGLWIGVSVLTCCEVLELVLLLIQSLFKRMTTHASRVEVRE